MVKSIIQGLHILSDFDAACVSRNKVAERKELQK